VLNSRLGTDAEPPETTVKSILTTAIALAALALPAAAQARVVELGQTSDSPPASCPDDCQAIGRVSGFQVRSGDKRNPFQLHSYGKIVAFSVTLGNPRDDQVEFFNDLFGGPPQVRLVILRPGEKRRYRLTGRSDVYDVQPYFGSTPTFALSRPLTVKPGYVVALSVPTWIPSFAVNRPDSDQWRSSRDPDACDDVRQSAAQTVRGSLRTYGCLYKTARLLYTATYIPDPKPTAKAKRS
jgi:hypothetical protein